MNTDSLDLGIDPGDVVGVLEAGGASTAFCERCGTQDTLACPVGRDCSSCGATHSHSVCCMICGAETIQKSYSGCVECVEADWQVKATSKTGGVSLQVSTIAVDKPRAPLIHRSMALIEGSFGVSQVGKGNDLTKYGLYHIVEEPGGIEWVAEVETPTEYYYDALRKDLGERFPKADRHVVDHLLSLEAFLDRSILSGFSFGVDKAHVLVTSGLLLGHEISRSGLRANGERGSYLQLRRS